MFDASHTAAPLFTPLALGALRLPNRVLMAPLTRNRAEPDGVPGPHALAYYRQRASAGLIFTEATQVAPEGKGYINTPGIHSEEQIAGWRAITDAVHAAGGRIALQLWHVGRISHVSLQPDGAAPVAPSAIAAKAQTFTADGPTDTSPPRALATEEIPAVIAHFAHGARNAIAAGFDAVEVHGANGYLIDQFLRDGSNRRTDRYGGSVENRVRFLKEVVDAVAAEVGADRTGVRLSPTGAFNDMSDSDPLALFTEAYRTLDKMGLAFLHVVEAFPGEDVAQSDIDTLEALRGEWSGAYIANGGFDAARAADWIARGRAHAVTFGRPFIANPDLPRRYLEGAPLNEADGDTFYGGDARGYTDYPSLPSV